MSEKRKDSKGRVLRSGESQRKDLRYMYRYDWGGKRHTVYANDLNTLRKKEAEVQKNFDLGLDYDAGQRTVIEMVERYVSLKQVRDNTKHCYQMVLNYLKGASFGQMPIAKVKPSDIKMWLIDLSKSGKSYGTLNVVKGVLKPAFQMALEEDAIRKNPFSFRLSDVVQNDTKPREALTPEQQERWLSFVQQDSYYRKHYDEFIVLLGTGLRIGEFCGLTLADIDFKNRKIHVDHQIGPKEGGGQCISQPKTSNSGRDIPISDEVYMSLWNIVANRPKPKVEPMVDGYVGFLFLDKFNTPRNPKCLRITLTNTVKKYNELHPDNPLPNITPHILRHTFCTNMVNAGMDLKSLQYVMGHSDVTLTLNVYTHVNYDKVAQEMARVTTLFPRDNEQQNASKSF